MNKEFKKMLEYAELLRRRYINTLNAFNVYEAIMGELAPNIVGNRRAMKNIEVVNKYKYFFIITKHSANFFFLIELAKFFDSSRQSLTIHKVLNYVKSNIKKFKIDNFKECHKNRNINPELFKSYKPINHNDIELIEKRIFECSSIINSLIDYRNQYLAHDDLKKIKISITGEEVKMLLDLFKDFVNLLYSKFDFASNSYYNYEKYPQIDVREVIKKLSL